METIIHNTLVARGGGCILAAVLVFSPVFLLPSTLVTHWGRLRAEGPSKGWMLWHMSH